MIFDGENKIYILSEQEYEEMYEDCCRAFGDVLKSNKKIKKLEKQLAIATSALKKYATTSNWCSDGFCVRDGGYCEDDMCATHALDDMENVE